MKAKDRQTLTINQAEFMLMQEAIRNDKKSTMMEKLLETAKLILEANPECALTGSLALSVCRENIREPQDIDIYVPYQVEFNPIKGMKQTGTDFNHYSPGQFVTNEWDLDGVKIHVIHNNGVTELQLATEGGIKIVWHNDVWKFKFIAAYDGSMKHMEDVIILLTRIRDKANKPDAITRLFIDKGLL